MRDKMTDKITSATELIEDLYGFLALLPRLNRAERAGFTTYALTHSDDYRGDSHIIFDFEDYAGTHGGYKIKVSGVAGGMYDDIVFSNLGSDDINFEVVKSTLNIHVKYYDMCFTIYAGLYQYNHFDCWDYEPEDENGERKCTREPMFEIDAHSIFFKYVEDSE